LVIKNFTIIWQKICFFAFYLKAQHLNLWQLKFRNINLKENFLIKSKIIKK
jgi:hypothetical protein